MGNSTTCKIVTPENFTLKLYTRRYVGTITTTQISVLIGTVGASLQIGEILLLCYFFDCPDLSVILSMSRAQVELLNRFSRFMAQTTCFHVSKCLLGVRTMGDVICGKYAPARPSSKNGRE